MDDLLFNDIIANERVLSFYQPIVNLRTGEIIGYEALSRGPEKTAFYSPLRLIEHAHEKGKIWDLEMLFRKKALERIRELDSEKLLFVNVDPEVIKSPDYRTGLTKEYLEEIGGEESRIVFEITERTAIFDYNAFLSVLNNYRKQGYQVAIDDVGAGYSGLKTINEIRPHFIKIDMDLIRGIDKDAFKQSLIKAFVDTSLTTNIKIIAEGIETKEELKTLILLGVHAGQGYYLKKPAQRFEQVDEDVLTRIRDYNKISKNLNEYSHEYHYISNLINTHESPIYESMTPCISVKNHLDKTEARSACICENQRPVGIVMKHNIDASMSGKYGYSLFSNKPISRIMNASPLIVDYFLPINVVAKSAMERPDEQLFDDLIVTKSGKYFGTVSMKKIFEYTLMYEKNNAKERNPLTGLPGNPVIKRVMSDAVTYNSGSCIIYVDINDFKIYNDVYGFEKGDLMIKYLADMMNETVKRNFPHTSFIGHVGGDDFVIVVEGDVNEYYSIAMAIIEQFEKDKSRFFTQEHYKKGSIKAEDRFGIVRDLSLTSIALAGLYGNLNSFEHSEALSEVLASLKKTAKKQGGSYALLEPTSEYFMKNKRVNESYSDEINPLANDYLRVSEGLLHP